MLGSTPGRRPGRSVELKDLQLLGAVTKPSEGRPLRPAELRAEQCPTLVPFPTCRRATSTRSSHPYTPLAQTGDHRHAGDRARRGSRSTTAAAATISRACPGLWCAGLGFGDEEMIEAATEQLRTLPYYHLFGAKGTSRRSSWPRSSRSSRRCRSRRCSSPRPGSEANDTQVKLAWYYNNARGRPEKKKIISRIKAYHGVTVMAGVADRPARQPYRFRPAGRRASCTPTARISTASARTARARRSSSRGSPHDRSSDLIEREGPDTIAAFIAEPVMGAGGVIVPPAGYFATIQQVLDRARHRA